ncbi:hypothetical protein [Phenylobacterium sp.]|uniref:hypothetical protein n=1 Tax=Phenylobacterium sp. TaxID=1871053 RepID=UPI0027313372|nr:hypothetical protein [Phenylobacterium sp.]MDP1875239.1 hypothetical protein [Phenylobacterium sp.]MDP3175383.1 hypothetical protein [Phenylobacterium sp.]
MNDSSNPTNVRDLDRINLRLSALTFEAIDLARAARPGHVSRNTWLTEAVEEKLARDGAVRDNRPGDRQHG